MMIQLPVLTIFLEHTWQTLAHQRWAIAIILALLALAPFIYLACPTRNRAGSPGILTIGVIIALAGFAMVSQMGEIMSKRIAHLNENNALGILENIYKSEFQFKEKTGRFGTLEELANGGLEGKPLAAGKIIRGYKFSSSDVTETTFCIHADRAENTFGYSDFNITETGEIRSIRSDLKGTIKRGHGENILAIEEAP